MANHEAVPRRSSRDTEGDVKRVLGKLEANARDLTINRLMANNAPVFRPFVLMSGALLREGVLPPLLRELVIMELSAKRALSYEWLEHVPMALDAGLTEAQLEEIRLRRFDAKTLSPDAELALRIAAQLDTPSPALDRQDFDDAVATWGTDGALELILVVGWWGGFVATFVCALGLDAPDGSAERPFDRSPAMDG